VFQAWDERGLAVGVVAATLTAEDTATVRTRIDGPRTDKPDTAAFYVDAWGAPWKTVGPIPGMITVMAKQDAVYPALVTKVTYPNGRIVTMKYDAPAAARANLMEIRDSTWYLDSLPTNVTTYSYGTGVSQDSPYQVKDALLRTNTYTYHPTLGLLLTATDPRGHVTQFAYNETGPLTGTVSSVSELAVETWVEAAGSGDNLSTTDQILPHTTTYQYDTKGNVEKAFAPQGGLTTFANDTYGRAYQMWDALNTKTQLTFTAINQVLTQVQYTTAQPNPFGITISSGAGCDPGQIVCGDSTWIDTQVPLPATVTTTTAYGAYGTSGITGPLGATRGYFYDNRGLVQRERDGKNLDATTVYGPSGLVLSTTSRAGDVVTYDYDAAGRRTSMSFPSLVYGSRTVPGDNMSYTHDVMGNLLTAANRNGTITRTYYFNGAWRRRLNAVWACPDFVDTWVRRLIGAAPRRPPG
jgi:YD repeat-containing protein